MSSRNETAKSLLLLIEHRTARLIARTFHGPEHAISDYAARHHHLRALESIALGLSPHIKVSIQQIECYAPQWADLVPPDAEARAELVHAIADKYELHYDYIPRIRAALGLDDAGVQRAYESSYKLPLVSIYTREVSSRHRLHWAWAGLAHRLETLPPFWTTFSVLLTGTVGAGILALPIALARLGPLLGVAALVLFGLINTVTTAYMVEAVSRSGAIRYGHAYIGRMISNYLGSLGAVLVSVVFFLISFLVVIAYYIGFAETLADVTQISKAFWVVVLFGIGIYYVTRGSLNATVASSLIVGAINIGLIFVMALLALTHFNAGYFFYVNRDLLTGRSVDPSTLELVFGVLAFALASHMLIPTTARDVLRRDSSGRSLLWGSVASILVATVLYIVWVLAVGSSMAPDVMATQTGTSLTPLSQLIGPSVKIIGLIYAILAMGMASVQNSIALVNLVRERVSTNKQPTLLLPNRKGRLLMHVADNPTTHFQASLSYIGLKDGEPVFLLNAHSLEDHTEQELTISNTWEDDALVSRFVGLATADVHLKISVLDASPDYARIRVTTGLALEYEGHHHVERLLHRGLVAVATDATKAERQIPMTERWRSLLAYFPIVAVFVITELLFLNNAESFTVAISVTGVLMFSLIVGIFPALLLISGRRKGEIVPPRVYRALGNRVLVVGIYLFYFALVLLYGLVIWQAPWERALAIAFAIIILASTLLMARGGAFAAYTIVELQNDSRTGDCATFHIVANGEPAAAQVTLTFTEGDQSFLAAADTIPSFSTLRSISFALPNAASRILKVWVHRINADGESEGMPAALAVSYHGETQKFDLRFGGGQVILPLRGQDYRLEIRPEILAA